MADPWLENLYPAQQPAPRPVMPIERQPAQAPGQPLRLVIHPYQETMGRPSEPPSQQNDVVQFWTDKGVPQHVAEGIADRAGVESSFRPDAMGDGGTSGGLYQEHSERLAGLKAFAGRLGKPWNDPGVQNEYAWWETHGGDPQATAHWKEIEAAPDRKTAATLWDRYFERSAHGPGSAQPWEKNITGAGKWNPTPLIAAAQKAGDDVMWVPPDDFMSSVERTPSSAKRQSLAKSLDAGEPLQALPEITLSQDGSRAKIADYDGYNRAAYAKAQGVDLIPVAVKGLKPGQAPGWLEDMHGKVRPFDWTQIPREPSAEQQAAASQAHSQSALARFAADQGKIIGDTIKNVAAVPVGAAMGAARIPVGLGQLGLHGLAALGVPGGEALAGGADTEARWLESGINALPELGREATTAGDIAGSFALPLSRVGNALRAVPYAGGALAAAAQGAASSAAQPVNVTPSAPYGAQEGRNVLAGAALGGAIGGGANMLAGAIKPAISAAAARLLGKDVGLTPGQVLGGGFKSTEEKLTSVPFSGGAVAAAHRRALEGWNRSVFNDVLGLAGERYSGTATGYDGLAEVEKQLSARYDQLKPLIRFKADAQYNADVKNLRTLVSGLPSDLARAFNSVVGRVNKMAGSQRTMDGQTFKEVESEVSDLARTWRSPTNSMIERKVGDALQDLLGALRENIERHSPPGVRPELRSLNTAWAGLVRLRDAVARRATSGGVFTPGDLLAAEKKMAGKAVFARGDGMLQQTARDAQEVMGNRYPDSGTAGRGATLGEIAGVGSAALANPLAAVGVAAAHLLHAGAYSGMGVNFLRGMAGAGFPQTRNALAEIVRTAGRLAAPAAGVAIAGP